MDNPIYVTLSRQSGLMSEMRAVANNIANLSTAGFRREGVIFAEHVTDLGPEERSLSTAHGNARVFGDAQGPLTQTGGTFDFAIEGEGYFLLDTPRGERLTRAGVFMPSAEGELVNPDGFRLLDSGGAPVVIQADGGPVSLARDGTLSQGDVPVAQVGLYRPSDPAGLVHEAGTVFAAEGGTQPVEAPAILQGFVEGSNVDAVSEIARMIEVQRAYEAGQGFLDAEDTRIRAVIQMLGR